MKSKISRLTYIAFFIISLLSSVNCKAQEIDLSDYKMLYNFSTIKQHDNSRLLEVSFIGRHKKDRKDKMPVFDAQINFINVLNDDEVLLGTSKTSKEGVAQLTLPENQSYLTDEEGNIIIKAVFEGTDGLDAEEEELTIKDIFLELDLTEVDSIKTVRVKAFTINSLGIETPVEAVDIRVAIKSMLSKMTLEKGSIENGEFEFEFPTDIPGDENDNLTVFSIIEDHEEFGNVIQQRTINWGVYHEHVKNENRKLWSDAAPIWMYIVLTIMIVGVWSNYIYTIINLFKIKKEGDNLELESKL